MSLELSCTGGNPAFPLSHPARRSRPARLVGALLARLPLALVALVVLALPGIAQAEGACCLGDLCVILSPDDCAARSGDYKGDDTKCDPNPCLPPDPTGACCVGGTCSVNVWIRVTSA